MSDRQTYLITDLAGDWIAGYRRPATPTVELTPEEAEYDVQAGVLIRISPPAPPPTPPRLLLEAGDTFQTLRGRAQRNIAVDAIETFIAREGGALAGYVERRGDEIGVAVSASVDRRLTEWEQADRDEIVAGSVAYRTVSEASAPAPLPDAANMITTLGFATPDDYGGSTYVFTAAPKASDRIIVRGGRSLVLVTDRPNIAMFGAHPDKTALQNKACIDAAVAWAAARGLAKIELPPLVYRTAPLSNKYGIAFTGEGLLLTGTGNLQVKLNQSLDGMPLVEGQEYGGAWSKQIASGGLCILTPYGDSTVKGAAITDPRYLPEAILRTCAEQAGVTNFLCPNRGISGTYSGNLTPEQDAGYSQLVQDVANPVVKAMLFKYGINDGAPREYGPDVGKDRYEAYADNTRRYLTYIRTRRPVAGLTIYLVTPTPTSDTVRGRDAVWYERIIPILRSLAREFECVFIDVYSRYLDAVRAADRMDTIAPANEHVHPLEVMNGWIWGDAIAKVVFDPFATAVNGYVATRDFHADYPAYKTAFELPSGFPHGTSRWRATLGQYWPRDGLLTTVKSSHGICYQMLVDMRPGDAHGRISFRTGDLAGNAWKRWSGELVDIAPAGGWVPYQPDQWGYPKASASIDGFVRLQGNLTGGNAADGQTIAILPEGYRPPVAVNFTVTTQGGVATVYVVPWGPIVIRGGANSSLISLNEIGFQAA